MKKEVDDLEDLIKALKKRQKLVAMLAPSFVVEFSYPEIISQLREIGFDKVVEITFGAKMINRVYSQKLKNSKQLVISSVCPGITETIKSKFPKFQKNLINVDSPMSAMAKICKNTYPKYKIVFISPCNFKKIEASKLKYIDFVINYQELKPLLNGKNKKGKASFNKFYNDYTKVYPISGGLSKTLHVKGILKNNEMKVIDGIINLEKFLKKPDKKIKFIDVTFCKGGCIGGPCISKGLSLREKRKRILSYMNLAKHEDIPKCDEGIIKRAEGISFLR